MICNWVGFQSNSAHPWHAHPKKRLLFVCLVLKCLFVVTGDSAVEGDEVEGAQDYRRYEVGSATHRCRSNHKASPSLSRAASAACLSPSVSSRICARPSSPLPSLIRPSVAQTSATLSTPLSNALHSILPISTKPKAPASAPSLMNITMNSKTEQVGAPPPQATLHLYNPNHHRRKMNKEYKAPTLPTVNQPRVICCTSDSDSDKDSAITAEGRSSSHAVLPTQTTSSVESLPLPATTTHLHTKGCSTLSHDKVPQDKPLRTFPSLSRRSQSSSALPVSFNSFPTSQTSSHSVTNAAFSIKDKTDDLD
jgi:hypothetical protein